MSDDLLQYDDNKTKTRDGRAIQRIQVVVVVAAAAGKLTKSGRPLDWTISYFTSIGRSVFRPNFDQQKLEYFTTP